MTGRGIDQILARPSSPSLHEPLVRSALEYVELAEQANGPIPQTVEEVYVWGAALEVLDRERPDVRIANLETSITTSDDFYPKGINYRMHPANAPVLGVPRIDCCALANNHVLDWGRAGLVETLEILARAGIRTAGAGRDLGAAQARGSDSWSSPLVPPTAGSRANGPPSPRGRACTCCRTSRNPRSSASPGWCSRSSGPAT
jgi:poly-gamma-glutamate capsule biosynthesis protein CapA/YwtB (metallophosphatase superfamily)